VSERKGGDFSGLSHDYQRYRPDYPAEITAAGVAFLEAGGRACDSRLLAVDVGAGTGISTRAWRRALGHACRIVGIEPGEDMRREAIASTPADQRIEYRVGTAEALPIATGEAGLVAAAQAAHWFDRPRFYAEIGRVLAPGGVIAVWSYQLASVDARVDRVIRHLHGDVVGAYWPPERALVERGYASLSFPFAEISPPPFLMEETWDLAQLIGYLGTWSAVARYREKTQADAVDRVRPDLEQAWGDPASPRVVRWPLSLRVGRKETPQNVRALL
jgi:SAM-dependent methyltransferase